MNPALTKSMKKKLRQLAKLAHERELAAALSTLEKDFTRWREGQLDPFELSDGLHRFHDGPDRDLYKTYVLGDPEWSVPVAIHRGILTEAEAGPELMPWLSPRIVWVRQGDESDPG